MKKASPFLLLIVLFAVAAWYFFTREPEPVHELLPPQPPAELSAETQLPDPQLEGNTAYPLPLPLPEMEPENFPEPLPLLNESDVEVKQALEDITGSAPLADYLVKDQVISRVVAAIDSLTSRQVPAQINPVKPAGDKFIVETDGERLVLSDRNFARYDGYIELLEAVDSGALMDTYQRFAPLIQEAWEQNGGEGPFSDRLLEVIDNLLETPDVEGPIYLIKPEAFYLFEDPELEALTAGQKILIRMGSANAAIVKAKLKELKAELIP